MSESRWAALIYGRTYEVDFRFIVTPNDFTAKDKDWAWNYIRVTTRAAEKLSEKPRWSLFKNEQHCVFGVTCMVKDLISHETDNVFEDMTRDFKQRPLYIFVGYVSKVGKDQQPLPIPNYSDKNLALFQSLYKYVCQKWKEKDYESQKTFVSEYQEEFTSIDFATEEPTQERIHPEYLNYQDEKLLYLWRNSDRQNLWFAASQCKCPASFCLGLASQKDILDSSFLNGTAFDVQKKQKIKRMQEVKNPKTALPDSTQTSVLNKRQQLTKISASRNEVLYQSLLDKKLEEFNKAPVGFLLNETREMVREITENLLPEERQSWQSRSPTQKPGDLGFRFKHKENKEMDTDFDTFDQEINMGGDDFESNLISLDLDNDGTFESMAQPWDIDGDGVSDALAIESDLDNDGTSDATSVAYDVDTDGDGMPDAVEIQSDVDGDGTSDETSLTIGVDTDGDGFVDTFELVSNPSELPPENSPEAEIVGNPACDTDNWHQQGYTDTCAVVSQEFILDELTGQDFSEDALRQEAIDKGYYTPGGGTSLENMGKLLEDYGIEVERTYGNTLEDLSAKLEQGEKVMVAIDSDEIWNAGQSDYLDDYVNDHVEGSGLMPGQAPDHAVQVVGIDYSNPDNPMVILNDPGIPNGQGTMVPANEFIDAWADSDSYMVATTDTGDAIADGNQQLAAANLDASVASKQTDTQEAFPVDAQPNLGDADQSLSASALGQGGFDQEELKQQAIEISAENAAEYQEMAQYWRTQADIHQNLADGSASDYHELEEKINFERRLEKTADAMGNEYTYTTSGMDALSQTSLSLLSMDAQHYASMCELSARQYESMAAEAMGNMKSYEQMDASQFTQEVVDKLASEQKNVEQQFQEQIQQQTM